MAGLILGVILLLIRPIERKPSRISFDLGLRIMAVDFAVMILVICVHDYLLNGRIDWEWAPSTVFLAIFMGWSLWFAFGFHIAYDSESFHWMYGFVRRRVKIEDILEVRIYYREGKCVRVGFVTANREARLRDDLGLESFMKTFAQKSGKPVREVS